MYSYYVNQNIYLTINYICVIVQPIYLFMIYKAKRSTQTRGGASRYILGVASFLFCSGAKLTIKKEKEKERKEPKERINKENRNKYMFFIFIYYIYLYIIYLGGAERG